MIAASITGNRCSHEGCKARPLRGGSYCHFHDPTKVAEVAMARKRGGLHRHGKPSDLVHVIAPTSANEVKELSAKIIAGVLNQTIEPRLARLALAACRTYLMALTTASLVPWTRRGTQTPPPDPDRAEAILKELSESCDRTT